VSTRERPKTPTLHFMTDAEFATRLRASLLTFKTLQARQGLLRSLSLPGVRAFALPSRPGNLFQQQVMYDSLEALGDALAPLAVWYRSQGVGAWRVPVLPGDSAAAQLLERFGHRAGDAVPAMGLPLEDVERPPAGYTLESPPGLEDVVELNGLAYGREDVSYITPWRLAPETESLLYPLVVREGGRAVACGVAVEEEGTAGIYLVATHPEARRRGFASAVMKGLHAGARARGCTVAVLQATVMGHGMYRGLGYRDVGAWTSWVYRTG
jgi:ribosomal protein S18 acetylase RimI-like enzyme